MLLFLLLACDPGPAKGDTGRIDADADGFAAFEDCDDGDAEVHAGAIEVCNGHDDNCDGHADEGVLVIFHTDGDGDGTAGGTLSANAITSTTQYNIGGNRVLALAQVAGIFVGRLAGASNTTGSGNSFFGDSAGRFNTTAANNSFFGRDAGTLNTASDNSFFRFTW